MILSFFICLFCGSSESGSKASREKEGKGYADRAASEGFEQGFRVHSVCMFLFVFPDVYADFVRQLKPPISKKRL